MLQNFDIFLIGMRAFVCKPVFTLQYKIIQPMLSIPCSVVLVVQRRYFVALQNNDSKANLTLLVMSQ